VTKAKDERPPEELSEQELEETNGEPLPERQAMTLIRGVEPLPFPIVPDDAAVQIDDPQAT
jgi:hypothetical protein